VVFIQEVFEQEYLNEYRIQVSVFMSIFNVHINWFPVGGTIEYVKHHNGHFHVAYHPKASENNEHTTIVMNKNGKKILFRQIAGYVARRIVCYAQVGKEVHQCTQAGFIKFGSRVDLLLPLDSQIEVKIGQKVKGGQTVIARWL
jgi:phosphatidylserine decarboxylase